MGDENKDRETQHCKRGARKQQTCRIAGTLSIGKSLSSSSVDCASRVRAVWAAVYHRVHTVEDVRGWLDRWATRCMSILLPPFPLALCFCTSLSSRPCLCLAFVACTLMGSSLPISFSLPPLPPFLSAPVPALHLAHARVCLGHRSHQADDQGGGEGAAEGPLHCLLQSRQGA